MVQLFPDDDSVVRLVGAILCEQNDEWLCVERRYMSKESMDMIGRVVAITEDDGSGYALVPAPNF